MELEQYLTGCKEKKQELKKTLKELEMKLDELKFRQPPHTTRCCCWPADSHAKGATTLGGRGPWARQMSQQGIPSVVTLQLPTSPALGGFLSRVLPQLRCWQSTQSSCAGSRRTLVPCLAWEVGTAAAWGRVAGSISALCLEAGENLGSSFCNRFGVSAPLCSCMDVSVVGSRALEEELRTRLQWEEARLEQRRVQLLRNQETLLEFENGLDNLFVRLQGITVPGQVPAQCWAEHSPGSAWWCNGAVG